jgi:hypothetical protein
MFYSIAGSHRRIAKQSAGTVLAQHAAHEDQIGVREPGVVKDRGQTQTLDQPARPRPLMRWRRDAA